MLTSFPRLSASQRRFLLQCARALRLAPFIAAIAIAAEALAALPSPPELISEADAARSSATAGALFTNKNCYSADGRFVVFESGAENLVAGQDDDGGSNDIFLHDRVTGTTVLVTHAAGAPLTAANEGSLVPSLSGDGRFVTYWSFASNLIAGQVDANISAPDVFIYDQLDGSNTLVSHLPGDSLTTADSNSYDPAISADGNFVGFKRPSAQRKGPKEFTQRRQGAKIFQRRSPW